MNEKIYRLHHAYRLALRGAEVGAGDFVVSDDAATVTLWIWESGSLDSRQIQVREGQEVDLERYVLRAVEVGCDDKGDFVRLGVMSK